MEINKYVLFLKVLGQTDTWIEIYAKFPSRINVQTLYVMDVQWFDDEFTFSDR